MALTALDEHQERMTPRQPSVVTTRRRLMPPARLSSPRLSSTITITGPGDHDRPDWLITMTGIRNRLWKFALGGPGDYLRVTAPHPARMFEPDALAADQLR